MDAQHVEDKLRREAKEAWKAYLAEKDPARSEKLEKRWNKAQDALDSFPRQQVAGGEDPNRAARFDLHGLRLQGAHLLGGAVQGLATRAGGGPRPWAFKGTPPGLHNRAAQCDVAIVEVLPHQKLPPCIE